MSRRPAVVIGVGNDFRRDDGVGPAVLAELQQAGLTGVRLRLSDGEPTQLLDAWESSALAIVVDAVLVEPATPGRVHRFTLDGAADAPASSGTHDLSLPESVRLGRALGRVPEQLVIYAVEAADVGYGPGLTEAVARAVPEVVRAVLADLAPSAGEGRTVLHGAVDGGERTRGVPVQRT